MDNFLPNLNMFGSNVFSSIITGNTNEFQSGKLLKQADFIRDEKKNQQYLHNQSF